MSHGAVIILVCLIGRETDLKLSHYLKLVLKFFFFFVCKQKEGSGTNMLGLLMGIADKIKRAAGRVKKRKGKIVLFHSCLFWRLHILTYKRKIHAPIV